jgi:hypothetical protein
MADVIYSVVIDLGRPYEVTMLRSNTHAFEITPSDGKIQVDFLDEESAYRAMRHIIQEIRVQQTLDDTLRQVMQGELEP